MHDLLYHADVERAIRNVRDAVRLLLQGGVPVEDLVVQKTIKASARRIVADEDRRCLTCNTGKATCDVQEKKGEDNVISCRKCGATRAMAYKSTQTPAIQVACRMERDPTIVGPKAGEEVPFIYVSTSSSSCCERAEHPAMAAEKGLRPDPLFYYHHQLKNVLVEVFSIVLTSTTTTTTMTTTSASCNNSNGSGSGSGRGRGRGAHGGVKSVEQYIFGDILDKHDAHVNRQPRLTSFFPIM